jgi:hypothetical protein
MKKTVIAILLLAVAAQGQNNSLPPQRIAPQALPGTVTLTLAEYNRLLDLVARRPKPPEAAPLPFVLSRAAFKLRVEGEMMTGSLDIDGDLLRKGPTKVPLLTGLTILDAQQSQRALPLIGEGATHSAVVNGPGAFSISLNVASALAIEAGRASFTLPVPAAGSTLLTLDIPGNHADVRIEPGLITSRATSNGHTMIEATLEAGKPARVWWTTREVTAPATQREARFTSDIKALISVGESDLRIAALCDIAVIQGEVAELKVPLPAGFEVIEVSGSTLDSSAQEAGNLILRVREPARRAHQFVIAIERASSENRLDAPFIAFAGAQGERGEVLVEGVGAMELTATEGGGLRRIDIREAGPIARSLARYSLQAAFRYHRRPGDMPKLALEWNQFPDSAAISAIADRATITTLLNVEGKSLTEVTLRVRNHAQPFVKVDLPQGATILSAEVEGEKVKPVQGADGSRVPMLRAGFRPSGPYTVSFVYLSAGAPFAKAGSYEMSAMKLDLPVSLVTWEVFLPERLEVKQFGGNALSASLLPASALDVLARAGGEDDEVSQTVWRQSEIDIGSLAQGQIGGIIADVQGAVIPGATVIVVNTQTGVEQRATSDSEGKWAISGVRQGPLRVRIEQSGFKTSVYELSYEPSRPARIGTTLEAGGVSEMVTLASESAVIERESGRIVEQVRKAQEAQLTAPSQNVFALQRRVAGILPVRVDVPRAGRSYRFVRPLVMEEETRITFQYRSR